MLVVSVFLVSVRSTLLVSYRTCYIRKCSFLVQCVERWDDEGHRVVDTFTLEAAPLRKSKNFILGDEDPKYYKEDLGFHPRKEWEEPLPVAEATDPVPTVSEQHIKMALEIHHSQVKYLHSLGVDACKEYSHQRVDYILEAVVAGDLKCKICGDVKKSTQSLRSHIRARHMESTPYECTICNKFFGDNSTYTAHKKKHDPKAKKFPWPKDNCGKCYTSQGRLTGHLKSHDPANIVFCQSCNKQFNAKKNCVTHEKSCLSQYGGSKQNIPRDIKCPFCTKDYIHKKDFKYHLKTSHASRAHEVDLSQY